MVLILCFGGEVGGKGGAEAGKGKFSADPYFNFGVYVTYGARKKRYGLVSYTAWSMTAKPECLQKCTWIP